MSRRATLVTLAAQAVVLAVLLTLALDQYVHAQTDSVDGVNHRGYRGDVAPRHAAGETRIMLAGGTRAFEAGTPLRLTMLSRLRHLLLTGSNPIPGRVTVINVAEPGAVRGAYASRLEQFRDLAPDVICIYVDLEPSPSPAMPGALSRLAGYVPALPAIAYLDDRLGRLLPAAPMPSDDIQSIADAVTTAATIAGGTIVAVPEPQSDAQKAEHDALMTALARFDGDSRVAVVLLPDAPPVERDGSLEPAAALQLEMPVRALLARQPGAAQ